MRDLYEDEVWLLNRLRRGPVPRAQVMRDGERAGITRGRLRRMRAPLGIVAVGRSRATVWGLPIHVIALGETQE